MRIQIHLACARVFWVAVALRLPACPLAPSVDLEQLSLAAENCLDVSSFHAASREGNARAELLQALYHGRNGTAALVRYVERSTAGESCDSATELCDSTRSSSSLEAEHQVEFHGHLAAALEERLQRLRRFAAAVRTYLPPRGHDPLPAVVVGAGPAGLLTAVEASVRICWLFQHAQQVDAPAREGSC